METVPATRPAPPLRPSALRGPDPEAQPHRRSFSRPLTLALALVLWGTTTGCPPNFVITEPMKTLTLADGPLAYTPPADPDSLDGPRPCALVLLPGGFDRPARFAREDFAEIVRARIPDLEVVVADAHLRYWLRGIALDRLRDEVVGPLRDRGYQVWLAGISLGGMGSLLYGKVYGESERAPIEGLVAVAPFLGNEKLIAEIEAAGGPAKWSAQQPSRPAASASAAPSDLASSSASPAAPDEPQNQRKGRDTVGPDLWPWLVEWNERKAAGEDVLELALAYGLADDFATSGQMLAPLLDEDRVFTHPGGHQWSAWTPLWREIVAAGVFDSCGTAAPDTEL